MNHPSRSSPPLPERSVYAVEFASGRAEGEQIGGDKKAGEVAKWMIIDGMPLQKVSKMTELNIEIVGKLAAEGAGLDEDA